MALAIQALAWERHNNVADLNYRSQWDTNP
jgi:hypothetical protein